MFRRFVWVSVLALSLFSCRQAEEAAQPVAEMDLETRARGIHQRVITLDTHCDIRTSNFTMETNYTQDLATQLTLPKMEAGGLDVAWLVVYVGQGELNDEGYAKAYQAAMDKFDAIHRLTGEIAPDRIELALTSGDVRRIHASGKKVAMIGVENGYPVGLDVSNVKKFADLGARYMSLSHNGHSQLCDSNTGERDDVWLHNGLSELGREVIAEMNKWGIMIDISHPSKESIAQMLEITKAPIIASHSSARGLCDHSRNLDDEQLLAIKANGGVVQTVALGAYLHKEKSKAYNDARRKLRESIAAGMDFEILNWPQYRELSQPKKDAYRAKLAEVDKLAEPRMEAEVHAVAPPPDVKDFVDHIDYMVKLMGIDHVGISSDFDGGGGIKGWQDASETFNITLELVRRGYTEAQIEKLWSGNLLRVLDEVQRIAADLQKQALPTTAD
ncbi:MAG: dipeptidase [Acidobacteriota bacterium]|nr:dipeptidase [Acidobacteriota bacterium]